MTDINRRQLLKNLSLTATAAMVPKSLTAATADSAQYRLTAQTGTGYILGAPYPQTAIWCYNRRLPGPEIRARQNQTLRIQVNNTLEQSTTLHCHGIRLPIDMDGVPGLTQPPIKTGETFTYEFRLPDAGTYWYHPHFNSAEQIGRGLYGALIVEEQNPLKVDRELTLVLDDWRLADDFQIQDSFTTGHDRSHAGRIGNTLTVNGRQNPLISVISGQRLRLRLINAANARTFSLDFSSHHSRIIAIDGHPVTPHEPDQGVVTLAAATRIDLIVDMMDKPGRQFVVTDNNYRQQHDVLTFVYNGDSPVRSQALNSPIELEPNHLPEPDLTRAVTHEVVLAGGAMGSMRGAMIKGEYQSIQQLVRRGMVWAMNGEAAIDHTVDPLITLKRNQSCRLILKNDTAFDHPMHIHGHVFRVLKQNDQISPYTPWRDTVMVPRSETVEVAFVADNPGDWMFHCHILEHQISGMSSIIRVL